MPKRLILNTNDEARPVTAGTSSNRRELVCNAMAQAGRSALAAILPGQSRIQVARMKSRMYPSARRAYTPG